MTKEIVAQAESAHKRLAALESHYAGQVTAFRQHLAALGPGQVLVVLLDMGKNVHWVTVRTAADEEVVAAHKLPTTQPGLARFLGLVKQVIASRQPRLVLVGHEPTGIYHEPWARALLAHFAPQMGQTDASTDSGPPVLYRFFNTYQVKLARQQTYLRPRKTDPKDLAALFDLAVRGLGYPAYLPDGGELLVRQHLGFVRAQSRLLRQVEYLLRHLVERLWPGALVNLKQFRQAHPTLAPPTPLIQTRPFQRQRLRILLAHCPNPHDLGRLSDEELLALYRHNGARAGQSLLRTLRTWHQQAVLPPPLLAETLAPQLQATFAQYCQAETLIEDTLAQLEPLIVSTPARHLAAIPGLTLRDGAAYLAGLGAVERFRTAAQVWAFAGCDPLPHGSGDRPERIGHISQRGDPALREALYQMGFRTAQHYAPLTLTFLDAIDRSQSEVEATLHTAHRLNRIVFHLLQHDTPFVDQATSAQRQQAQDRWQHFVRTKRKGRRARRRPPAA